MTVPRKLGTDLERQVALAYLCGVSIEYLTQRWGISHTTIEKTSRIRSREWQDTLVDFYRKTNSRDRLRNAIHLYLTFNGQGEGIPNAELINRQYDEPVYEIVDDNIFAPRTKKLIEETNLERILGDPIKAPFSKEERLLKAIFGEPYRPALRFVNLLLYPKLREAYQQSGRVNIDDIYTQVANEIYLMLKSGLYLYHINTQHHQQLKADLEAALDTLTPKERDTLKLRFGIGVPSKTLAEVGRMSSVTRERIRKIEAKALRKLRYPSRTEKLRRFLER